MLKIDIQICFIPIPPPLMQNFIEIHQRNPELLSSGGFRPPPRLDRGIERPRLDRVKLAYIVLQMAVKEFFETHF